MSKYLGIVGNHNNPHEKQVYREMQFEGQKPIPPLFKYGFYGLLFEATLNGHYAVFVCHFPIYIWNHMFHSA